MKIFLSALDKYTLEELKKTHSEILWNLLSFYQIHTGSPANTKLFNDVLDASKEVLMDSGAHRLDLSYESKCQNLHGHNWIVTVYCCADRLNKDGMVCDFKHIKDKIHGFLDHGNLNELLPFNPTAENIARWIVEQIPECYKATVQESEGNVAMYITNDVYNFAL